MLVIGATLQTPGVVVTTWDHQSQQIADELEIVTGRDCHHR